MTCGFSHLMEVHTARHPGKEGRGVPQKSLLLCLTAHNVWGPSSQDLYHQAPSKPQKREEWETVKKK